jgi:two-component system, OmpR family, sensor histidine kinase VicK
MSDGQGSKVGERHEGQLRLGYDLFDREPDPALDELTSLTAVLCGAEYAYAGWMDSRRLWFKSQYGFKAPDQPRTLGPCQWVVDKGEPLLIRDASKDRRFPHEGIPLMGARPCRSYAGMPLITSSQQVVGTLAIYALEPERFSAEHLTILEILARQVVTRLEFYRGLRSQELAQRTLQRTERALATERCFVAGTLDSIPFLAALLDTAGNVVRLNYTTMQLTGYTQFDAVGLPFTEQILEGSDRSWAEDKLREAAAGQVSGPHETDWRAQGGRTRRVSWTLRPLSGPTGDVQYLIVSGQDVTEQREAEMALISSETRYQQTVENSLGFLFTCTMDGRLTSLNAYTAETLGYNAEALAGRAITELLDDEGAAAFEDCLKAVDNREEWQGSLRIRRSDGVYRRIAFRSRRMNLPDEKPFVLNHGIDVTEQHEAEEALHLATRQRELILESVGDGIYGIDLVGRLTFINQAAAEALGYSPEELTGRDVHEVIYHSRPDGSRYSQGNSPILQAMHRSETIRMRDEIFWRGEGTSFPVDYSASPLVEDGRISGMVVAFQDISERRRLERMKDEFLSTVGHELRTPLTSLRASLGLISSGSLDKLPEKRKLMVEMAIGNCDRLVRLVNDILDFDAVEKGRLPLNRLALDAGTLLQRAADTAKAQATAARVEIRVAAAPAIVIADEARVLQVLSELITNALKFSPPETTIRLTARPFSEREVLFSVEDQGRGIAREKLEKIFERFQQGDASDTRSRGGTGLGLALCRSMIEQHGGKIWAESEGPGSRFLFTLPAAS